MSHVEKLKSELSNHTELMKSFPRFQRIIEDYVAAAILDLGGIQDDNVIAQRVRILSKMRADFQEVGQKPTISKTNKRPKLKT